MAERSYFEQFVVDMVAKLLPSGGTTGQVLKKVDGVDYSTEWADETGGTPYTHPNHSGDVTSAGDGAQTIANGAVTLAKMANLARDTIIGRKTTSTGVPEALSASDIRTLINVADGATANAKASGAEVNTGTDDAKFVTAKAIADSFLRNTVIDFPDASHTLALTQAFQTVTPSRSTAQTLTIPLNSAVAFPIGTRIDFLQIGAGKVTFAITSGGTLYPTNKAIAAQYKAVSILKIATDTWVIVGDTIA